MSANIITITREFGSGGRTVGRLVAQELGYAFYDWNLVEKIAASSGFAESFIEENGEEQDRFAGMLTGSSFGFNLNEKLFEEQSRIILEIARRGNCVIVGRCADYLLRNEPRVLSCFVYAAEHARQKRVLREYGESDIAIEKRIREKDRRRKAHYQYFTGRKWGRAFYYDLCIDTSRLDLEDAAAMIVLAARNLEPGPHNPEGD